MSTLPREGESDPEVEFLKEKRMDAETGPVPDREKRKKQKHPQEDQDRMEAEEPNNAETGPVPEAEKKHPKHPQEWIDRLLIKYKKEGLQMFEDDGEIHLRCSICYKFYTGQKNKSKKFNWSRGITDSRTWERYHEHLTSAVHCKALSLLTSQHDLQKRMENAIQILLQNFKQRKVEEKLRTVNVVRNLYSTMTE